MLDKIKEIIATVFCPLHKNLELSQRVRAILRDTKQAEQAARLLLYCEFRPDDIRSYEVTGSDREDDSQKASRTVAAALFALDNFGPATMEFPFCIGECGVVVDPRMEPSTIGISVRCMNEGMVRLASMLLHGAGAKEISTELSNIG